MLAVSRPARLSVPVLALLAWASAATPAHAQGIPQRLAELEARLAALEAAASGPLDIAVNCAAGQSVNAALAQGAGRSAPIIVRITGVCLERVIVARDDVTLAGASPGAGLAAPSAGGSVLAVRGAQRTRLFSLTLDGGNDGLVVGAGGSVSGWDLRIANAVRGVQVNDAVLSLFESTVEHNQIMGIVAGGGGRVSVNASVVQQNGFHGVSADGGSVEIRSSTVRDNGGNGVFGWRGAAIHIAGGALQGNRGDGLQLQAGATGQVSLGTVVSGNSDGIALYFGSTVNLRGVTVENNPQGGLSARGGSAILLGEGVITVRNNGGAGLRLGDTSVAGAFGQTIEITGNAGGGIVCAPPPAVAQIVPSHLGYSINLAHVFGNAGPVQISCPGF